MWIDPGEGSSERDFFHSLICSWSISTFRNIHSHLILIAFVDRRVVSTFLLSWKFVYIWTVTCTWPACFKQKISKNVESDENLSTLSELWFSKASLLIGEVFVSQEETRKQMKGSSIFHLGCESWSLSKNSCWAKLGLVLACLIWSLFP